jgi:ribosome biogenesis GTPase / thiamine phosphate phosphatase
MFLKDLGYNETLEKFKHENDLGSFVIGRVIAEHKERYIVATEEGELEAEITGNMRFTARGREDFPAVGDWVALTVYEHDFGIVHKIFPRSSVLQRQAVGIVGEIQILAVNVDYAFLVQAADRDFNINRLERYLTICYAAHVEPIIVLTKTDLVSEQEVEGMMESIRSRIKEVPVVAISNATGNGLDELQGYIFKGKTYCLLGSSGVGKSSLLNNLSGKVKMKTDAISKSTSKGRHVTSHRELTILQSGGLLIDNPGLREVGIADTSGGLEATFDTIEKLADECRFKDCTHTTELGCRVLEAVESGEVDRTSYENYMRMEREKAYFTTTHAERRKRDKKFGKMYKYVMKTLKKNKD